MIGIASDTLGVLAVSLDTVETKVAAVVNHACAGFHTGLGQLHPHTIGSRRKDNIDRPVPRHVVGSRDGQVADAS